MTSATGAGGARLRPWRHGDACVVAHFRLTPKASKDAIGGLIETIDGAAFSARVRALPVDGDANNALEELVARWLGVPLYILLGWVAAWFVGPIMHGAGVAALVLLIVGGALYSIGGVLYGLKWPNPWPTTFGHHEFFHACTAVAAILHYIAMWFAVFSG